MNLHYFASFLFSKQYWVLKRWRWNVNELRGGRWWSGGSGPMCWSSGHLKVGRSNLILVFTKTFVAEIWSWPVSRCLRLSMPQLFVWGQLTQSQADLVAYISILNTAPFSFQFTGQLPQVSWCITVCSQRTGHLSQFDAIFFFSFFFFLMDM